MFFCICSGATENQAAAILGTTEMRLMKTWKPMLNTFSVPEAH